MSDNYIDIGYLEDLLAEHRAGRSKNEIERDEFDKPQSHGKYITGLWRKYLGEETEGTHRLVTENAALRARIAELEYAAAE